MAIHLKDPWPTAWGIPLQSTEIKALLKDRWGSDFPVVRKAPRLNRPGFQKAHGVSPAWPKVGVVPREKSGISIIE
jgi:hypothetical protein